MNRILPKALPTTRLIAAVLMTGGLLACQGGSTPAIDTAAEANVIMELERDWSRKFTEGDVDWIIDLHTADARQLPPGAEWIVGTDALRAAWEGMSNTEGLELSWESTGAHVSPDGGMAYDYGKASMTTADGKTTSMKYLVVWTRVGDEWKIAADMFNSNEAPGT